MVPEFSKPTFTYLSTNISYLFFIFLLIQKFANRVFFVHSGNRYHVLNKQNLGPILGPRQNERLKILFCFPENPQIIKLTINLIIVMIPFFKKSYVIILFSKLITLLNDSCHSEHQHSLCFPFHAILFTPDTFTVRYGLFLLHFLTQKHFFRQTKLMTTPMKGTVPYTGKAGSLIFVSCDVTQRKATPTQVDRRKIPKMADVCLWYATT